MNLVPLNLTSVAVAEPLVLYVLPPLSELAFVYLKADRFWTMIKVPAVVNAPETKLPLSLARYSTELESNLMSTVFPLLTAVP